jgi:hypothetical protein
MPNPNWVQVSAEFRNQLKSGEIVNATVEQLGQYLLCLPHISELDMPASDKKTYSDLLRHLIQLKFTKDLAKESAEAARVSAEESRLANERSIEASRLSNERSRQIAKGALIVSVISAGASILFGLITAFRIPTTIINTPAPVVMVSTNIVTQTNTVQQVITNFVTVTNK